jgi:hypothetical protein
MNIYVHIEYPELNELKIYIFSKYEKRKFVLYIEINNIKYKCFNASLLLACFRKEIINY